MIDRDEAPVRPTKKDPSNQSPHIGRVIGVLAVIAVVALPLLFSEGFNGWNSNPTNVPYAAPTGIRFGVAPTPLPGVVITGTVVAPVLHSDLATNRVRFDESVPISMTFTLTNSVSYDMTGGQVVAGSIGPGADGVCCVSPEVICLNLDECMFAGTNAVGRKVLLEYSPGATPIITETGISTSRPSCYSGNIHATSGSVVTWCMDPSTSETALFDADPGNLATWTERGAWPTDTFLQNRHPGSAVDPENDVLYLAYGLNTDLKLISYDLTSYSTIWQESSLAQLGTPPDATFNYNQVVYNDGRLAVMAPRDTDTVIRYSNDVGGLVPPGQWGVYTMAGAPTGDYQALSLTGEVVSVVRSDPDGTGIEIFNLQFADDPSIPPNVRLTEDNTVDGTWHNTPPPYIPVITGTEAVSAVGFIQVRPNAMFIIQGDQGSNNVRYGSVEVPVFFDGFESGSTVFWDFAR